LVVKGLTSIQTGSFPFDRKILNVVPIPNYKAKDNHSPSDYRLISPSYYRYYASYYNATSMKLFQITYACLMHPMSSSQWGFQAQKSTTVSREQSLDQCNFL